MAATVRVSWYGASAIEPAGVTAETGIKYSRENNQSGSTAPIPIPTTTGTNYSWVKLMALEVTGADATTGTNYTIRRTGAPTGGLELFFKGVASYTNPTTGPGDSGSDGPATPATYTVFTASAQQYDAGGDSLNSTGRMGDFADTVMGVDSSYAGGGGTAIALPDIEFGYDEA